MIKHHDRQYKKVFSTPILAQKLLTSFVHEKFIKHLDFDTMTRKDKSYVTPNMKKYESDIVYEIYFKDRPVYIYILMEFQSTVDKKMPIRFLRYILKQDYILPPFLFYCIMVKLSGLQNGIFLRSLIVLYLVKIFLILSIILFY